MISPSLPTELSCKHVLYALAPIFWYWVLPLLHGIFLSPLRRVPGPFLARVSRLWEFYSLWKGQSNLDFIRLHEKYGPVVRIAPNRYSFSRQEDVKTIYALGGRFFKSDYYAAMLTGDPLVDNMFPTINDDEHRDRRRKISSLYTMSTMITYEKAVDEMTAVLTKKLRAIANEGRPFHFPRFMQYYAFDVIGQITFDQSFGMMEKEYDPTGMLEGVHRVLDYLAHIGLLPDLHPFSRRLTGKDSKARALVDYTFGQIDRYRRENHQAAGHTQYAAFLQKLLDMQDADKITMVNIQDAAASNLGAGSDTTAITMSSTLYYLYKNPEVLAKLRREIDTMVMEGRISDPITFQEAQSMPYLQAVINESFRMHPAVGTILPRVVPKGGVKLGGFDFPEGTHVGANSWVLHYDKDAFGPDADVYRPERWLQPEAGRESQNGMMFTFGAGSRACIGKNIALLEINKVVPQFVRNFDIVMDDKTTMETYCSWFVYPTFEVRIKLREGVE
ncbi:cytochrome protein [Ilyonectria sp. MPI-CAGE-AT-0026]|nr:cytochrome protein [Ilyonectria sp. MPI-CAGE-AT-0026]